MNFTEFQTLSQKIRSERPGVLDCSATNLYSALARLIPPVSATPKHAVHRCHLAAEWAQCFGFSPNVAGCALVSSGVRDSLALLFRYYAETRTRLWLPADNYPVYGELARAAGLAVQEFITLPAPVWPDAKPGVSNEVLVLTNPVKPLGRWLTAEDVAVLTAWLAASPNRRLLLDAVYTFDLRFHATTLQLVATGQAILLHSLTKGWLHPRLFGITLVPRSDARTFGPIFRAHPPSQPSLARAREFLSDFQEMPAAVGTEIAASRTHLLSTVPTGVCGLISSGLTGYFTPVLGPWSDLLEEANVLGIPASVFGSSRQDITILSSLNFLK
jgi:histidinol-phosphate/aromatic aminotransferase/cobyric acid decarboxylase-like protein